MYVIIVFVYGVCTYGLSVKANASDGSQYMLFFADHTHAIVMCERASIRSSVGRLSLMCMCLVSPCIVWLVLHYNFYPIYIQYLRELPTSLFTDSSPGCPNDSSYFNIIFLMFATHAVLSVTYANFLHHR